MTDPMDDLRQASADVSGVELKDHFPDTKKLSPAANAVLTAVTLKRYDVPPEGLPAFAEEMAPLIAAALRAAVDQVVPENLESYGIRYELLRIATELQIRS